MENIFKYIIMTALVCLSATAAVWSFTVCLLPTIEETLTEKAADKYFEEVVNYAAENAEVITEYAKRELELRQEKNAQCYDQVYFNENSGALGFFEYGWVSYSEPMNESKVLFIHRSHSCDYIVTYTETPLNYFTDIYEETAADNIYLYHRINEDGLVYIGGQNIFYFMQ
ncbi:MAG: hypothetical protein K2K34_08860 [Oscillospiraceae bacterium]|nr:hypothetical protein [Oscillospiraceae bacterium]